MSMELTNRVRTRMHMKLSNHMEDTLPMLEDLAGDKYNAILEMGFKYRFISYTRAAMFKAVSAGFAWNADCDRKCTPERFDPLCHRRLS